MPDKPKGPIPDAEGALDAAERLERRGQHVDALAVAKVILDELPNHGRAAFLAGRCMLSLRRPAEAVHYLETAVKAMPDEAKAFCALGDALEEAGRLKEALAAYARSTNLCYELAWGWFGHGTVARRLSLWGDAERSLTVAIELRPDLAEAYMRRGLARVGLGKDAEAKADLKEAVRLQPDLKGRLDEELKKGFAK